ncbi:unnamed protein product [Arabidopsis halleri]
MSSSLGTFGSGTGIGASIGFSITSGSLGGSTMGLFPCLGGETKRKKMRKQDGKQSLKC